ncbi:MAG: glycerol-3-phosphate 1-O-acyltransferase PlsY [candidate division WOR-3 bacterium]
MTNPALQLAGSLLFGFVCGSVPFGWLAGRLRRLDIRQHGSGNIGFANVQRTMGWKWALPVLLLDSAKGALAVLFSWQIGLQPVPAGLGAVCGHIYTPWLRFNGGKGVATTLGVAAVLFPRALLAGLLLYLIILLASGFVSLASLCFALLLVPLVAALYPSRPDLLFAAAGSAVLIILRHRANLSRLIQGSEPRLTLWLRIFQRRS